MQDIEVIGSKVHNLKGIDVHIPRYSLTVITGLSGSGKSSLAFDTIYSEGQRRYIDTFSAYARGFLGGGMERPNVEEIKGLAPVISIDQKTTNRNPRSTVGTVTEVYDFLRLLYARAGIPISYLSNKEMVSYSESEILDLILERFNGRKVLFLAPLVVQRKGHYKELFETLRKKGYLHVRVDGQIEEVVYGMKLSRYQLHNIEVIRDKLKVSLDQKERIANSLNATMREGKGMMMVLDMESQEIAFYSRNLMCPETGLAYREPAPHNFSFNSPNGYCPRCKGLGVIEQLDWDSLIPDPSKSIISGGLKPFGRSLKPHLLSVVKALFERYDQALDTPISQLPKQVLEDLIHGSEELLDIELKGYSSKKKVAFAHEGLIDYIVERSQAEDNPDRFLEEFLSEVSCPECLGKRLNKESLHYFIDGRDIGELASMELSDLYQWFFDLEGRLSKSQKLIAEELLKEIRKRLRFLIDVGLEYLSLNRVSSSLSGGESQRIRLATQIGTQLVEVLYILDEPSIGLHQQDNERLINSLLELRDLGNTVIVVEHDEDMMYSADHIIDIGPRAGLHGGELMFEGPVEELLKADTLTAKYLNGSLSIPLPEKRRLGHGQMIQIKGASGNNLKNIDVNLPLGTLIGIVGVSGSGKSTLINQTLYPALNKQIYNAHKEPLAYKTLLGLEHVDKVVAVDQAPIGRTPRSNPATYVGVFTDIRNLFVNLLESKMRGYKAGRFSFNVNGGRCATCQGNGSQKIEMNFLPDVYTPCPICKGKRYNRETLEVRYRGKSIADVLDLTIEQALEFFDAIPKIKRKIQMLYDVGLGYVKLGQSSTSLSGGESQRIKLASELSKRDTGKSVYILDEPTTGLHFEDIRILLEILNQFVERGNTVIVIEHNLDVIKSMDYLVEIGPKGGSYGGELVFQGTPEALAQCPNSPTAKYLRKFLKK